MEHDDRQAQEDEMDILTEILDADCFTKYVGTSVSGKVRIKLRIPGDEFKCRYIHEKEASHEASKEGEEKPGPSTRKEKLVMTLKHLPPLTLHFTLPLDYPSNSKPIFTLSSEWLHRKSLSFFCGKLDQLWEENQGMAILYTWYSFLQEDAFSAIGICADSIYDLFLPRCRTPLVSLNNSQNVDSHSVSEAKEALPKQMKLEQETSDEGKDGAVTQRPKLQAKRTSRKGRNISKYKPSSTERLDSRAASERVQGSLVDYLVKYENEESEAEFRRTRHLCTICFSEKRGSDCLLFECQHCFCKECLQEFFRIHITEGSIDSLKCPNVDCKTVPTPYDIKAIVSAEIFERYDSLLLSKTLDSMSDILHCPRVNCGRPVIQFDHTDKLAKCASCDYAFCSICKMVYHGVEPCRFKSGESKLLFEKYREASSEEKKQMERMYGKKQLDLLVQQTLSEEWVNTQSKPCPHCKVPIEKFEGCNKVTCFKCATYFCWICATQLDKQNPYFHFNNPASSCFNNLFRNFDGHDPADEDFDFDGFESDESFEDSDSELFDELDREGFRVFDRGHYRM